MAKFQVQSKNGKSFYLDDKNEIHRGGEGRIILLPAEKGKVAKIYHGGVLPISELRYNQLQKLDNELFVKPLDLLYENNKIIGFKMEYAGSDYFPLSSLFNRSFCHRNAITDKFKTIIAKKIIEAVKQAHFNGFVIGDLNQYNVLVNLNVDIRLIDVDSYETPGHKHTGVLLDEIRDYYYNGVVSMNSDYFALSVLLFYLLTYTHPFKGIHQKYKTLAERMVKQLPVFVSDKLLKVPKCYEPIQNKIVQTKFEKIYANGERFLFSLDGFSIKTITQKPVLMTKHEEKDLVVKPVLLNSKIFNVYFNPDLGMIEQADKIIIYSSKNQSYVTTKIELPKDEYEKVYLGNENILARKDNRLYHIKNNTKIIEIENFRFSKSGFVYQLENILISVANGQMYWIYLDEVLNHSIKNKRTEVFSEGMLHHNGLIQNTGGVQRIFYHTGKDLATVKLGRNVKQVYQYGNIGLVQFIDNKKLVNRYFKINGLHLEFVDLKPEVSIEFAYMQQNKENGFIFEPEDNKLFIRRTEDFKQITEMQCSKVSRQSSLFYTKAGIIIWEEDEVYLVNKKQ